MPGELPENDRLPHPQTGPERAAPHSFDAARLVSIRRPRYTRAVIAGSA